MKEKKDNKIVIHYIIIILKMGNLVVEVVKYSQMWSLTLAFAAIIGCEKG